MTKGQHIAPATQISVDIGMMYSEMNTILRRIRRRTLGEPTNVERTRLMELRENIARRKKGELIHHSEPTEMSNDTSTTP